MSVIDENAFGILIAHYDLESTEYSLGEDAFLEYMARFSALVERGLAEQPLSEALRQLDLGHAIYLEFADGDQQMDPITWARTMRQSLIEADIPNVCVLTAGGRWGSEVEIQPPEPSTVEVEPLQSSNSARESGSWRVSTPSE